MVGGISKKDCEVRRIEYRQIVPWLLKKHYARRIPSISWAFGLYRNGDMVGVVSYGKPSSSTLQNGIAGKENAGKVIELNRLVINDGEPKNAASFLVARSIKMIPSPKIIVSYADAGQGHVGYVYQACNFIYTGLSAKRTDWKIRGMENLHGQTISDMARGIKNRAKYMREKFGDAFYLAPRPRKHRYVYFLGCKSDPLKYPIEGYPKGDSIRYDAGAKIESQAVLV